MPTDGLAAGQTRDGLVHHGLEDGRRQIRPGRALVDQRLNVGLGEHAAAGGDGVQLPIVPGQVVEAGGIGLEQGGHLVDKGSGAPGAHAVHALLEGAGEINDLRVLAAQLDGHVSLRRGDFQGGGHGHHLLHEACPQGFAQGDGAGAGHGDAQGAGAQQLAGFPHHLGEGLLGVGAVAAVFAIEHLARVIQDDELDGGGADVNTGAVDVHGHVIPTSLSVSEALRRRHQGQRPALRKRRGNFRGAAFFSAPWKVQLCTFHFFSGNSCRKTGKLHTKCCQAAEGVAAGRKAAGNVQPSGQMKKTVVYLLWNHLTQATKGAESA